jgi:hypothetical protein
LVTRLMYTWELTLWCHVTCRIDLETDR